MSTLAEAALACLTAGRQPSEPRAAAAAASTNSSGRAQPLAQAQLLDQQRVRVRPPLFPEWEAASNLDASDLAWLHVSERREERFHAPAISEAIFEIPDLLDRQRIGVRSMRSSDLDPEDPRDASGFPPDHHFSQRCSTPEGRRASVKILRLACFKIARGSAQPNPASIGSALAAATRGPRSCRARMSTCAGLEKRPGRIACIQLDSKHADVARNVDTALRLAAGLIADRFADPVDLVVLPELALTGYVFESREELDPLLEDASTFSAPRPISRPAPSSDASAFISACRSSCVGSDHPSLNLAAHVAQQLQCHVVIGFPERGSSDHDQAIRAAAAGATAVSAPFDARPIEHRAEPRAIDDRAAYNSAALIAPDGSLLHVFRKHFLFETDEKWAVQGSGFQALHLPALGTVCVAICMDLNPFRFTAPFEDYELASFCVEHDVDLLVMPMAWLAPSDERHQLESDQAAAPLQPSLSTINYWALRCKPFFQPPKPSVSPSVPLSELGEVRLHKQRYLITANRVGRERDSIFGGSSCVLQMKPHERPLLIECLNSAEEACLVTTLPR